MFVTLRSIAVFFFMVGAFTHGQQNTEKARNLVEAELVRIEEQLPAMMLRADAAAVGRLTADDFVSYDPQGREVRKADILARMNSSDATIESLAHEQIRVRVFGDAAVATGISVVKGHYQGQPVGGRFRYTRVWVMRGGQWLAVAAHSSTLVEQ